MIELIQRHRSRGLPSPVDADVLARAGVSPSLIPRTLQSLVGLDLITDKGEITPQFEGIRKAPEAEYNDRILDWLNATYADVLAFADPATDDETKIRDAFRNYKPYGQQERMVTLFLKLYAHAGVAAKPAVNPPPRIRPAAPKAKVPAARTGAGPSRAFAGAIAKGELPPDSGALPPALSGLLAQLPSAGEGWTKSRRHQFIATFGAVLDFCFPIVEVDPAETETIRSE